MLASFVWYTLLSSLWLELANLLASVIFPCREYLTTESDQSVTDLVMKTIQTNYIYSTSKLRTTKCHWPLGVVIGSHGSSKNYWIAYITSTTSNDQHGTTQNFTIYLYARQKFITVDSTADHNTSTTSCCGNHDTNDSESGLSQRSEITHKLVPIPTYRKYGRWRGNNYRKITISTRPDLATPEQISIVESIQEMMTTSKKNGFTYGGFFVIAGETGSGKSTIAKLLAHRLHGSLCDNFMLTDPGYSIYDLLHLVEPEADQPLILLLDEFDHHIHLAHQHQTEPHKWLTTAVKDKASWNTFADQLVDYDNVVVIATTNRTKDWFDQLDPSYLRDGRVSRYFTLTNPQGPSLALRMNQLRFRKNKSE